MLHETAYCEGYARPLEAFNATVCECPYTGIQVPMLLENNHITTTASQYLRNPSLHVQLPNTSVGQT